ncbi:Hypothetical predicted protein [Lecanosticta acicola]|uniref:HIT-type domain-containing protein n=1 Tax=Lecanosticta acicola TaxID=111012 RepID=A0AAI8Z8Q0_9PEZI|nr:Hypothetical predicted protein [Lecanosticta acicola]
MASGALRFRTPHIEELPSAHTRQAPGFAWVAVSAGPAAAADPAKTWGTLHKKRPRTTGGGQTDGQKEALSARRQREAERKVKELNSDPGRDAHVAIPKKEGGSGGGGGGVVRAGKTPNTKKILASGKTFAHYLDDEEAEIARTGRREVDMEPVPVSVQRASKTPIARRKSSQLQREEGSVSGSPAPSAVPLPQQPASIPGDDTMDVDVDADADDSSTPLPPLPTPAEMEALLNAPPLTYNQARAGPPPPGAPPARKFCEICGYWGRVKCMKCGNMTCSVLCKDAHDENKCLKFYA